MHENGFANENQMFQLDVLNIVKNKIQCYAHRDERNLTIYTDE